MSTYVEIVFTEFAKYEGAGNDFVLIDNRRGQFSEDAPLIAHLCDRHFGIGGDGLMTLSLLDDATPMMHYYNSDGSLGEMCGNGARCFSLFLHHLGIFDRDCLFRATDGEHRSTLLEADPMRGIVELGMTPVTEITTGDGWWFLNTGVPHYVEFTDDLEGLDIVRRGRAIRQDLVRFPEGTNVNFVKIEGDGKVRMRTYERGVEDETLACGTGATAVAIITNYAFQPHVNEFSLWLPGGKLKVAFDHSSMTQNYSNIRLTGPARRVFGGQLDSKNF